MIIDENYKRRVRIIGKPGDVVGLAIEVRDIETNEMIENAFRIEILLDANELNTARIHYYESGKEPSTKTVTVQCAEVDVTAFEVSDDNHAN